MATPLRRSARARPQSTQKTSRQPTPDSDESEIRVPDDSDSEDEYVDDGAEAEVEEDEGMEVDEPEPEPESEDDEEEEDWADEEKPKRGKGSNVTPRTPKTPKTQRTPRGVRRANLTPRTDAGRRSTATALSNSTLNAYPPAYRDLLLQSANSLTRKDGGERPPPPTLKAPIFPLGVVTPFSTHLASMPRREQVATFKITPDDSPHKESRRDRMREKAKRVAVIPPWQAWEGEGWWPEMCAGEAGEGKGKGKASSVPGPVEGWQWRSDVRLGLDGVGRDAAKNVIPASEGRKYVPSAGPVHLNIASLKSEKTVELKQFDTTPIDAFISTGFIVAAGAPVWGLDWCPYPDRLAIEHGGEQYVALSTIPEDIQPAIGARCSPDAPGSIQIWSVLGPEAGASSRPEGNTACEIVLCLSGGPALDIRWMPLGAWDEIGGDGVPKIGILAAVQLDGSLAFYAVPHPRVLRDKVTEPGPTYLRAEPLLKLSIADAACTCIQWLSGHRIVTGLANGHIVVWDIVDALISPPSEPPLPSIYATVALSAIRSLSTGRCPPTDADGDLDYSGEALYVAFGAMDGTTGVLDMRDPSNVVELNRSRLPCMATAWSHHVGVPLYADVDYMVIMAQTRANLGPATYYLTPHRGPVWEISTSDYHTMVASAASDGSVLVSNCGTGFYRRKQGGMLFQRLYELDYDEHTHQYRMTDNYRAEASGLEEATSKATHKNSRTKGNRAEAMAPTTGDAAVVKSGAWSKRVAAHRVAWQSGAGMARAGWIASGGWSGIVRVEQLVGKWLPQPK